MVVFSSSIVYTLVLLIGGLTGLSLSRLILLESSSLVGIISSITYSVCFRVHGILMVFFIAIPLVIGLGGTVVLIKIIGLNELAIKRFRALRRLASLVGLILVIWSMKIDSVFSRS